MISAPKRAPGKLKPHAKPYNQADLKNRDPKLPFSRAAASCPKSWKK